MATYLIIEQCEACPYCQRITASLYFCLKFERVFPVVRDSKKPSFCTSQYIEVGKRDQKNNTGKDFSKKDT